MKNAQQVDEGRRLTTYQILLYHLMDFVMVCDTQVSIMYDNVS